MVQKFNIPSGAAGFHQKYFPKFLLNFFISNNIKNNIEK